VKNRYLVVDAVGNRLKVKGEERGPWFESIKDVQDFLSEHPLDLIGETVYVVTPVASCYTNSPQVTTTFFGKERV